jgi:Tc5 transposase DNA-binding domain
MPDTYQDIEKRVIEACEYLQTRESPNIAKTARVYNIPVGRLRRRFKGKAGSRIAVGGHNKALDDAAEKALCLYIDITEELGFAIREKTLVVAANAILRNHHSGRGLPRVVSKMWASRWLSRYPEYRKKARKPLATVRKNTHDPTAIQRWFDKLLAVKIEFGIVDKDIYKIDETGFRIGVGRQHKVITRVKNRRQYLFDPDNRDYMTAIECISVGGISILLMFILKAANLQERWIIDSLYDQTALACSATGYSNDEINLEWLRHFDK